MSKKTKTGIHQRKPGSPEAAGDVFYFIVPTGVSSISFQPKDTHAPTLEVELELQGGAKATATILVDGPKKPLEPNESQQFQVSQAMEIDMNVTQGTAKLAVVFVS